MSGEGSFACAGWQNGGLSLMGSTLIFCYHFPFRIQLGRGKRSLVRPVLGMVRNVRVIAPWTWMKPEQYCTFFGYRVPVSYACMRFSFSMSLDAQWSRFLV